MSALSERLASLPPVHRNALKWFWDRRGALIDWPEPLDGLFLVNRPKGIHKPANWDHVLSVRQSLNGPYADKPPQGSYDAEWRYQYFQEGLDPASRDKFASNRGLVRCKEDEVPVAVLIQETGKPRVRYRVWGLGRVIDWKDGYFTIEGYLPDGEEQPALEATEPLLAMAAEPKALDSVEDARRLIERQIVARQGGAAFRAEALERSGSRCAITNWEVPAVLEAAHIVPYRGLLTNEPDNALLLRADIHTLFDRELLSIDPQTLRVVLADSLKNSPYAAYEGVEVRLPTGVTSATLTQRLQERRALLAKGT
ncbi:HNH endonuclease [Brevundimonas sp.]|uniref:HNH endonuclease n=1 Tax=Brevundimonas sp. TaxID=1871086 RepID=UPI002EDA04D3